MWAQKMGISQDTPILLPGLQQGCWEQTPIPKSPTSVLAKERTVPRHAQV